MQMMPAMASLFSSEDRSRRKSTDRKGSYLASVRARAPLAAASLCTLADSDSNLLPVHCNASPNKFISPHALMAESLESLRNPPMGLRDCLAKMCSRRAAARKPADEPFDKHTSEYYSCGKKGVQNRRLACRFSNVDFPGGVDGGAHSFTSDSDASDSSCVEDDASARGAQQTSLCGAAWRSTNKSCDVDYVENCKVSGLSLILAENKALIDNSCKCRSEACPILNTSDNHNIDVKVQRMGAFPSVSIVSRDHLHDRSGEDFGSQHGYDEEESSWEGGVSSLSLSPAQAALGRKFPPPLNMLALQSYSDKRGRSPEACATGHCLRSFRQDGRFVLQEVRAPTHKYFRALREDGRLKLELFNAVGDSSQEDDETSASDVCVGVKGPVLGVVREVMYTSKTRTEDTCTGTSHVGMHALCDEPKVRVGSNIGCVRTYELVSTGKANAGVVEQLEHVEPAALDIQRKSEVKAEAANISSDVGACVDEQIPQGNLIFGKGVGAEDMVRPLIESPCSPSCPEMKTLYNGHSAASIKRSWVRPISAF